MDWSGLQEELFADPAWDMLLDLLQAQISHLRVPVSSLCIAAAVPASSSWPSAAVDDDGSWYALSAATGLPPAAVTSCASSSRNR